jgi:endonuclease-3 related protein
MAPQSETRGGGPPVLAVYRRLFEQYGAQGWWPLVSRAGAPGFDSRGYHPGRYRIPRQPAEGFEVAVGAVLTQNTSWRNAEAALKRLLAEGLLVRDSLLDRSETELADMIRPSGYFNQKARKLRILAEALRPGLPPDRSQLLALWGIGAETADSILLYAYHVPSFVIDGYTRRLAHRLGWIAGRESYTLLQRLFAEELPGRAALFGEFHALIVRHAKEHCRKRALCSGCPLLGRFCGGSTR